MSDHRQNQNPRLNGAQVVQIIIGIICFAALMGIRDEFHSIWMRTFVAACAGAVVGIVIVRLRNARG